MVANATTKEMVKLKREITTKNVLSQMMQAKPGAGFQEAKETRKAKAIVLATGVGNRPAVWVLTGGSVQFSSGPGHRPDLPCVGWVVTRTRRKLAVLWPGCTQTAVPLYGSCHFRSN